MNAAKSTIQGNRENLQRLVVLQQYERVTAPFSGVVTERNIDVGALILGPGQWSGRIDAAAGNHPGWRGRQ